MIPRPVRTFLFWCHLAAGLAAGVVVLIMSSTGVLLTYEKALVYWADTRHYAVAPPQPDAPRRALSELIGGVARSQPLTGPATITVRANPQAPVAVAAGPRVFYVDPYSAAVLGEGSPGVRRFFRGVTDWHRTLALTGGLRPLGRGVTGAANLVFLFIIASGLILWCPRVWSWQQVRAGATFQGRLRGRARDFNWHNAIGFWCAVPLFFIVLGATVISFPWASSLAYRIVGEKPPVSGRAAAPAAAPGESRDIAVRGLDEMWSKAEAQVPGWRAISLRLDPGAESVVFTIDRGTGGQPQRKGTLTFSRSDAERPRWEPFEGQSRGRQFRSWLRFVHTGEFYGFAGQTIAGLASLGGTLLVLTGFALAVRRLLAWIARARRIWRAGVEALSRKSAGAGRSYSASTAAKTSSA